MANGYESELHTLALQSLFSSADGDRKIGTVPTKIPEGVNNNFSKKVNFTFAMADYKVGYMRLNDADSERFEIPDQAFTTPKENPTMRMRMLGFELSQDPFYFSFTDVTDRDNVYVTSKDSNLVMMDKFMQMDLKLPSQRLFGFGERVHEFRLGEGTWTMWAKG